MRLRYTLHATPWHTTIAHRPVYGLAAPSAEWHSSCHALLLKEVYRLPTQGAEPLDCGLLLRSGCCAGIAPAPPDIPTSAYRCGGSLGIEQMQRTAPVAPNSRLPCITQPYCAMQAPICVQACCVSPHAQLEGVSTTPSTPALHAETPHRLLSLCCTQQSRCTHADTGRRYAPPVYLLALGWNYAHPVAAERHCKSLHEPNKPASRHADSATTISTHT